MKISEIKGRDFPQSLDIVRDYIHFLEGEILGLDSEGVMFAYDTDECEEYLTDKFNKQRSNNG